MKTIWRLEKERYASDAFRGKGSLHVSGRWHHKGTQVAYASEHPAVAILEKLVWLGNLQSAESSQYQLLSLHVDTSLVETIERSSLPEHWDTYPHANAIQNIGSRWFEEGRSAVLEVPSAVLPMSSNFLINPFHPNFHEFEQGTPIEFTWDERLFEG